MDAKNKNTRPTVAQLKSLRNSAAEADGDDVLAELAPPPLRPVMARTSAAVASALKDPIGQVADELPSQRSVAPEAVHPVNAPFTEGNVYQFPLAMVRESKYNARVYYRPEEVSEMVESLAAQGQLVPARGYVKEGVVYLIDGQKRFRAALAAGVPRIRVEVCTEPVNAITHYIQSREINKQRSEQTALDDAVRFQEFLETGLATTHEELAKLMGMSQPKMTKTLALNKIPEPVLRRMRDYKVLSRLGAANAISQFFSDRSKEEARALIERRPELSDTGIEDILIDAAIEVIDAASRSDMSGNQIDQMVKDQCTKIFRQVKHRPRAESRPVEFGGMKGTLKTFEASGRLDLSIKGLDAEKLRELSEAVERVFAK